MNATSCNHIKSNVTFFRIHCTKGESCTKARCSTAAVELHSSHWTSEKSGPVEWSSAAYLSNDDGHTPRAAPYPPFPPFLCLTKAEMMTAVILIVVMRMMVRAMVTLTRVNAKGDHSVRG